MAMPFVYEAPCGCVIVVIDGAIADINFCGVSCASVWQHELRGALVEYCRAAIEAANQNERATSIALA
jgi:hypothetical protein